MLSRIFDLFSIKVFCLNFKFQKFFKEKKLTYSAKKFFLDDFNQTLYPLDTTKFLVENGFDDLTKFIEEKSPESLFFPQTRVYSPKNEGHLRRTHKLDPIAEFAIYLFIYKNRNKFKKCLKPNRTNFGYRFSEGLPIQLGLAFSEYNKKILEYKDQYEFQIKFDIASYFNSIYHHDLQNWLSENIDQADAEKLSILFRKVNSGISVDFLTHGIYPTKMIGSHFLSFIDYSDQIRCEASVRLMDDICLFSNSRSQLMEDFQTIQKLLGYKMLNVNPEKTSWLKKRNQNISQFVQDTLDSLNIPIEFDTGSGLEIIDYEKVNLSNQQINAIVELLGGEDRTDEDTSLLLQLIIDNSKNVTGLIPPIIFNHPSSCKKIFIACAAADPEVLAKLLVDMISNNNGLSEYQLFWIAKIAEAYLTTTSFFGVLLIDAFQHKNAGPISKAKVLEIPINTHGLRELREPYLKNGESSWLSWSAAVGSRNEPKQGRNHVLQYFRKNSAQCELIASIVEKY